VTRFVVRRLAIIPIALFLAHFFGFAYAHLARPLRAARNPFLAPLIDPEPLLPTYFGYLQQIPESGLGAVPGSGAPLGEVVLQATLASLGLLSIALTLSIIVGWFLGMRAVRTNPPRVARWMTIFSTIGLATPSFYLGTLLIVAMFAYVIWRGPGTGMPFPTQGFGWDIHLVLPVVTLMLRPTAQIAVVISGLLVAELDKQYVVTARSLGHPWKNIRERGALRNIVAPVVLTIAGSARLLMAELIVVDGDSTIYVCADIQQGHPAAACFAFEPESGEPVWHIALEQGEVVAGGAVVPGRLYVAIREGFLYAIGESQ